MNIFVIMISSMLVSNVVLSQFLGICPFLGVSKKVETAAGMGAAVTFVITIASAITYPIYYIINLVQALIRVTKNKKWKQVIKDYEEK